MRISFREADFDALTELWNDFYPAEFKIDADLLRQNTVDSPVFDWGASQIAVLDEQVLGFVAVKQPAASLYPGPDREASHLSAIAFRDTDAGIDLLAEAKNVLRNRGQQQLNFGMDSRHFFPGCPCNAQNLCSLLMVEGFEEGGECYDVERDLTDYEPPKPLPTDATYRVLTSEDISAADTLIGWEFSGRWRYDVLDKLKAEGPGCVMGVFDGKTLAGFALIQESSNHQPIGGGVWRSSLGSNWGSLGPIGVAEGYRGRGWGGGLLSAGLMELKARGVGRCIIDWTVLTDFYGRHGFEVSRTYRAKTLRLGD